MNTEDSDSLRGALQSGVVDLCVTSVHKNLGSLSASALINVGKDSRIDPEQIKDIFIMINTTSPSPYLLFDIEGNVRTWISEGQ